jgi:hypothetical protein
MNSNDDDFIDDAKSWATMPVPGTDASGDEAKAFAVMPIPELAAAWCALQYVGLTYSDEKSYHAAVYFDHLPHEQPERAFALVLAVLRSEADKSVKMQLNQKLMTTLLHKHSALLFPDIESAAQELPQMRWLLGGSAWWAGDKTIKSRLEALADEESWRADEEARSAPKEAIDFPSLSAAELARVWVEQKSKPEKDQDDNWSELMDFERELLEKNPDAMIDMIVEVLKFETNRSVLGLLAAGPLEDAISYSTIDRIEREAAANAQFASLLGGVWYHNEPEDLQKRLDAIVQGRAWAN